jgi:CheY-like chemotaxis protein
MTIPYGPILVVEDVPNVLELLEVTLRYKGYFVLTARNGQEALDVLKKQKPALVITDILMPKLDGYAFVYQMRTNPETNDIPVIFLSATYVTPEDRTFAMNLGAARFIEKHRHGGIPATVAELIASGDRSARAAEGRDFIRVPQQRSKQHTKTPDRPPSACS